MIYRGSVMPCPEEDASTIEWLVVEGKGKALVDDNETRLMEAGESAHLSGHRLREIENIGKANLCLLAVETVRAGSNPSGIQSSECGS